MSDIFKSLEGQKQISERACRVAYTLGNEQPVLCTIIGDQPLFYMDYQDEVLEDELGLFEDADFAVLETELRALKEEIDSLDRFSENFAEDDRSKIERFLEDADVMCETIQQETQDIDSLIKILAQSRLAEAYMNCAKQYDVSINYSHQIEKGFYDRRNKQILINPILNETDQILVASQELRRHYQHRMGALIHPLMFDPDNAVLINRVQICDLAVSMVRIAWELQLAGMKDAWERIENSQIADLGRAFAREAYLDFRTINNGEAAAAVFEAWFLSERCRGQDKVLIQQMLSDYQGYVFDIEEATQNITPTLIAALGEMPFGKNYLAEHAVTILNDPIFLDIRDRSNANFLWFIKFERSFRETEHDLQSDSHLSFGTRPDGFNTQIQDENYGSAGHAERSGVQSGAHSADIITLFSTNENGDNSEKMGERLSPKSRSKRTNNKGADIISLEQWSSRT